MKSKLELITQYHEMLNAIRVRKQSECNVEHLKTALGISRTTADKFITDLTSNENEQPLVNKKNRTIVVNADFAYFLGISIGSLNIRVSLLDLNFEPVDTTILLQCPEIKKLVDDKDMLFNKYETDSFGLAFGTPCTDPQSMSISIKRIRSSISKLVSHFLDFTTKKSFSDSPRYEIFGIGFAVAGPVDYAHGKWVSAPHITSLQNITIQDLIGYENIKTINEHGIFLSIDNNAKTAIISEYYNLLVKNNGNYHEDLALIYIGSGIGSAAIIDGKLLRGRNNFCGELGQIQVCIPNAPSVQQNIPQIIGAQFSKISRLEEHIKEKCTIWLPYALCSTICMLGIENVILAGHTVRGTDDLIPSLMDERTKFTVASTQQYCKLSGGRGTPNTAAIGAAIESYYTMCNFDKNKATNRTNLASNISM